MQGGSRGYKTWSGLVPEMNWWSHMCERERGEKDFDPGLQSQTFVVAEGNN